MTKTPNNQTLEILRPVKFSDDQVIPKPVNNPTKDIIKEIKRIARIDIYGK